MSALPDRNSFDDLEDMDYLQNIRNLPERLRRKGSTHKLVLEANKLPPKPPAIAQDERIQFSYTAARHEYQWLVQSLEGFFDGQWIDDVLRLVKGGKEANVYQARAHASAVGLSNAWLAAKVYRPRRLRNLKNDQMYREGRTDLHADGRVVDDDGMLHAIAKRTEYGRELLHNSWIGHELRTMRMLHEAGADVPNALASSGNAILMTYIGDAETAAPVLSDIRLPRKQVQPLFERVLHNIELMLSHNRIHADLSAFNILYWEGEITLIDFPQAIHPDQNRSAYPIFERDVVRVCEYFQRQGLKLEPHSLARSMWQAHQRRIGPEIDLSLLDPEDDRDRQLYFGT